MSSNCVEAPAKLNLGLRIVGRRADGYHELESLFWPIALKDRLTFQKAASLNVTTGSAKGMPTVEQNLIFKAALAMGATKWEIDLEKAIPLGGGLGGGSSDAGATLRFLSRETAIPTDKLSAIALSLGADVPFFLQGKPAWVTGVGENVRSLEIAETVTRSLAFLLVLPPFGVPTKEVFQAYQRAGSHFSPRASDPPEKWDGAAFFSYLADAQNDLEPFACALFPPLREIISALRDTPCKYAGLSGSGSTCFAVFQSPTDCENSLKVLQRFLRQHNCRSLRTETFLG